MEIGDLVRIQHRDLRINGKLGVIMAIVPSRFFGTTYSVRVPSFDSEVTLFEEQCRVIA